MSEEKFALKIDGREVIIDQGNQEVSILDENGAIVFRERIQVAAGSVQGLFNPVKEAIENGIRILPSINPIDRD